MNKTLVQHVQELNDTLKEGGLDEETRMCCLSKIGAISVHSHQCELDEINESCNYIDDCLLKSDEVPEEHKAMIMLGSLIRGIL